jgi:hypothetical protein
MLSSDSGEREGKKAEAWRLVRQMDAYVRRVTEHKTVWAAGTILADLQKQLVEGDDGTNGEAGWRIAAAVLRGADGAVAVARQCGLALVLLMRLRELKMELLTPCHTDALLALSFKATKADADALVAADAVPVGVRLLQHLQPECVTDGVVFLLNILAHGWGTFDDGHTHPHFASFMAAGADQALLTVVRTASSTHIQKSHAALALARLYKNKALPAAWSDVAAEVMRLVDGDDTWARTSSLCSLQGLVSVPGIPCSCSIPFTFFGSLHSSLQITCDCSTLRSSWRS